MGRGGAGGDEEDEDEEMGRAAAGGGGSEEGGGRESSERERGGGGEGGGGGDEEGDEEMEEAGKGRGRGRGQQGGKGGGKGKGGKQGAKGKKKGKEAKGESDKAKREMATGGRGRCPVAYIDLDELVAGVGPAGGEADGTQAGGTQAGGSEALCAAMVGLLERMDTSRLTKWVGAWTGTGAGWEGKGKGRATTVTMRTASGKAVGAARRYGAGRGAAGQGARHEAQLRAGGGQRNTGPDGCCARRQRRRRTHAPHSPHTPVSPTGECCTRPVRALPPPIHLCQPCRQQLAAETARERERVQSELVGRVEALAAELGRTAPNMRAGEQYAAIKEREREQVGRAGHCGCGGPGTAPCRSLAVA